jgi:ABC-2 type transport system ATP-binding protein
MGNKSVVIVKDLVKKFGDFTAVDQINFEVNQGEIFGFLGPNGSGKTTTIRMMLGLLQPTSGYVEVLGEEIDGLNQNIRSRIGYMSQRFSLYNDLTVLQNLEFYSSAYGLDNSLLKQRIGEALELAGLVGKETTPTKDLSGGWRQRLALSVAIIHRPEMIFLDEPTAGVDPISRRTFWDLLYQLVSQGVTIFVTTHYMDEAEHCHRLGFIHDGKIIAMGTPDEIKKSTFTNDVIQITPDNPIQTMALINAIKDKGDIQINGVELYGAQIHIFSNDARKVESKIKTELKRKGANVKFVSLVKPSLEDVFIASVGKDNENNRNQ